MTDPVQSVIIMMKGQGLLRIAINIISIGLIGFLVAGCPAHQGGNVAATSEAALLSGDGLVNTGSTYAGDSQAASFLVAHRASRLQDMAIAADKFNQTLTTNPKNKNLLDGAFQAHYRNGNINAAADLASAAQHLDHSLNFGSEPALVLALHAEDWVGALAVADLLLEDSASQPIGVVIGAWALAFQDRGDAGLTRLLELARDDQTDPPAAIFTQSALITEYLGRSQDALAAANMALDHPNLSITSLVSMIGILARHGKLEDAKLITRQRLGSYFNIDKIIRELNENTSPLLKIPNLQTALAEAYIDATNVPTEIRISRLARAHAAAYIAPEFDKINYILGLYYRDLNQIGRSAMHHGRIDAKSIWFQPAQFLKARRLGANPETYDDGMAIFDQLVAQDSNNAELWKQKGHTARRQEFYKLALSAYEQALLLAPDDAKLHYYVAIAHDRLNQKPEAEKALRQSLILDGGDAYALNYLGYWLLEEGGDPEEALNFIRSAIEKQPQNGYFMDSLGWGYYKLGRLRQALTFMERAVVLRPNDPLITDHLGDVYAAIGRQREAVYQWQRALVLLGDNPSNKDLSADGINKKISDMTRKGQF